MMLRWSNWLLTNDRRMLLFLNLRLRCSLLDIILPKLTHTGGATFTIICSLFLWLLGGPGLKALLALGSSHLLVHVLKKKFNRERPYLKHDEVNVTKNPLKDFSFPSGHTTAITTLTVIIALTYPILSIILFPIALLVGISRIYLGLHYPTDVIIGGIIGSVFALLIHFIL